MYLVYDNKMVVPAYKCKILKLISVRVYKFPKINLRWHNFCNFVSYFRCCDTIIENGMIIYNFNCGLH